MITKDDDADATVVVCVHLIDISTTQISSIDALLRAE